MKKIIKMAMIFAVALSLTACATHPDKIAAQSISPVQYQEHSCKQVSAEVARINSKMSTLYGSLKKTAGNDSAQMAVGMILFWPALFFLEGGDGAQAAKYSKLKGELDALEKISIQKKCNIDFPEPVIVKEETKTKKKDFN